MAGTAAAAWAWFHVSTRLRANNPPIAHAHVSTQVNIQLQNFTSVLQLNGNASSPPIATAGARGYVVDSTSSTLPS